jgi:hypothetical protein
MVERCINGDEVRGRLPLRRIPRLSRKNKQAEPSCPPAMEKLGSACYFVMTTSCSKKITPRLPLVLLN